MSDTKVEITSNAVTPLAETSFSQVAEAPRQLDVSLKHAKDAYENVQSVIRFVDTKTAVLMGIVIVTAAGVGAAPFWIVSLDAQAKTFVEVRALGSEWLAPIACFAWIISLLSGIVSVLLSLLSLIARPPNQVGPLDKKIDKPHVTILFPVTNSKDDEEVLRKRLNKLHSGIDEHDVLNEYGHQLLIVGKIVNNKIWYHRKSVGFLFVHLLASLIAVLLAAYILFVI